MWGGKLIFVLILFLLTNQFRYIIISFGNIVIVVSGDLPVVLIIHTHLLRQVLSSISFSIYIALRVQVNSTMYF